MKNRKIRIPAKDYRPTKAELEETVQLDLNGLTFEEAAQRLLRPAEAVSADQHRERAARRRDA